jgi:hypothetical protein
VWANGDRYSGRFLRGARTGIGELIWKNGERYRGHFAAGLPDGEGLFEWPDGRVYEGRFAAGRKSGRGTLQWPNGNRYEGEFADDARSGLGTYYWRDGTVYQGEFAGDRMQGYGVKRTPDGSRELQHWEEGRLVESRPLREVLNCRLVIDGRPWMFESRDCVNGLAHGRGLAASVDGDGVAPQARCVLGKLVEGRVRPLRLADS